MTADHLTILHTALGPDAADRYEQLRWRLARLFPWERCTEPETLAESEPAEFAPGPRPPFTARCLAKLEPDQRLLLRIYDKDKQREKRAESPGIQMNALRHCAPRLREKREKCPMFGQNPPLGKKQ